MHTGSELDPTSNTRLQTHALCAALSQSVGRQITDMHSPEIAKRLGLLLLGSLIAASAILFGLYAWGLNLAGERPVPPSRIVASNLALGALWAELEAASELAVRRMNPISWFALLYCYESTSDGPSCEERYPGMSLAGLVSKNLLRTDLGQRQRHLAGASLAIWLTRHWSTEELLSYVAQNFTFSERVTGFQQAAEGFFGQPLTRLQPHQAALLAALSWAPRTLLADASCGGSLARTRRDRVISAMVRQNTITPEQGRAARAEPLGVSLPEIPCQR